jgi:hypothetical protein
MPSAVGVHTNYGTQNDYRKVGTTFLAHVVKQDQVFGLS